VERKPRAEATTFALHDAKNMVCALQMGLEWLRQNQRDRESFEVVDEMAETCATLSRLLLEALETTHSGNAALSLDRQPQPIADLVESVARRVRARAARSGVSVVVESHDRPIVSLDESLFRRVLENLTDNALRVSPIGSQLTLRCGTFGENAVITVTDQGPGVDPARQDEIFSLYSHDEKTGGTGIGLAFCRRVVDAHGGCLTVDSLLGDGASFGISLPLGGERGDGTLTPSSGPDSCFGGLMARNSIRSPSVAPILVSERPALDEELWFGKLDDRAEDLAAASLAARVGRILGAKPFPAAARRLDELTRGAACSIDEVVRVLEGDPALSARLLRLVNSVGYALRVRCSSVRHATVLVGTRRLNQLATTAAVLDLFDQSTSIAARLVEHASTVGSLCRYLAVHLGLPRDELATCGFLHDIGKLMLLDSEGPDYRAILERYAKRADRMHEVERERFGFDHAVLGAHVLAAWNIPEPVPKVVAWHHQPARAVQNGGMVAAMVQALRLAISMAFELAQTKRAEAIETLASSDMAMYLEISAPQLAAMWGDLEALHDAARTRGSKDAVPDIVPRRPSVEPKSSTAPSLPKHFPCVVCDKASFGSTCTACGAYACPEHWLASEQWCTSCATTYRTESHTPPWSVVAVSSGLMATASGTAALASGSGLGSTLVVASLSAVCAATVSVVVSRARERVRFLRGRGIERELASQSPDADEDSLERLELPPTPILPGLDIFEMKDDARDRATDPAPPSTDARDHYLPGSVSIAPVIPIAPNMPTLSVLPDPFGPVNETSAEAIVITRTEPLPPRPVEPFALASDFPTPARATEPPEAEAAPPTEAPPPEVARPTDAPVLEITHVTDGPPAEIRQATVTPPEIAHAIQATNEPVSATFVAGETFDDDDDCDSRPTLVNDPPPVERRDSHPALVLLERKPRAELRYNTRASNGVRCTPEARWYGCASGPSSIEPEQRPSVRAVPEWSEQAPRYATP
jgi:putative nucleotidyltransferase with HDIG domain